jgi:hypothetical protein
MMKVGSRQISPDSDTQFAKVPACTKGRLWGLTFEVRRRRRHDARARLAKMYRVPPTGPWWHAVGARLDRVVRRRWMHGHGDF